MLPILINSLSQVTARWQRVGNIGNWIFKWLEYSFTSIVCSVITPSDKINIYLGSFWSPTYWQSWTEGNASNLSTLTLPRFRKQLLCPLHQNTFDTNTKQLRDLFKRVMPCHIHPITGKQNNTTQGDNISIKIKQRHSWSLEYCLIIRRVCVSWDHHILFLRGIFGILLNCEPPCLKS